MTPEEAFAQLKDDAAWPLRPSLSVPDTLGSRMPRRAGIAWRVGLGAAVSAVAVAALVGVLVVRGQVGQTPPAAEPSGTAAMCDPADVQVDDMTSDSVDGTYFLDVTVSSVSGGSCLMPIRNLRIEAEGHSILGAAIRNEVALVSSTPARLRLGFGGMCYDILRSGPWRTTVTTTLKGSRVDAREITLSNFVRDCGLVDISVTPDVSPLVTTTTNGGGSTSLAGTLALDGGCLSVGTGPDRVVLVLDRSATWDAATRTVSDGGFSASIGEKVSVKGGEGAADLGGVSVPSGCTIGTSRTWVGTLDLRNIDAPSTTPEKRGPVSSIPASDAPAGTDEVHGTLQLLGNCLVVELPADAIRVLVVRGSSTWSAGSGTIEQNGHTVSVGDPISVTGREVDPDDAPKGTSLAPECAGLISPLFIGDITG